MRPDESGQSTAVEPEGALHRWSRRVFSLPHFNLTDGLDDYAEDYRQYRPLAGVITAGLRHRLERLQRPTERGTSPATEALPSAAEQKSPPRFVCAEGADEAPG